MKTKLHLGRGAAVLACATALAAVAFAPTASAHSAKSCANHSIKIKVEGGSAVHIPVKAITTEGGVSCAEAYKVITGTLSGEPPKGWKSASASFEPPPGLIAQQITKGSKKIKYAVRGG